MNVFASGINRENSENAPILGKELAGASKPGRALLRSALSALTTNKTEASTVGKHVVEENEALHVSDSDASMASLKLEEEKVANTSLVEMYEMVGDLDLEDGDNIMLMPYYVKQIFDYLLFEVELYKPLKKDFMAPSVYIKPRMRLILVDWLVQVHQRYELIPETLYLAIFLIDRYLQVKSSVMQKSDMQLLGVTAMFVAAKYEEIYPPEIGDFVYITDSTYTSTQICEMEKDLLTVMDFRLSAAYPITFLRRLSKVSEATDKIHHIAKYLSELALLNNETCYYRYSASAAAAFSLSSEIMGEEAWTPVQEVYSGYRHSDILPIAKKIVQFLKNEQHMQRFKAIKNKYLGPKAVEFVDSIKDFDKQPVLNKYLL